MQCKEIFAMRKNSSEKQNKPQLPKANTLVGAKATRCGFWVGRAESAEPVGDYRGFKNLKIWKNFWNEI